MDHSNYIKARCDPDPWSLLAATCDAERELQDQGEILPQRTIGESERGRNSMLWPLLMHIAMHIYTHVCVLDTTHSYPI